MLRFTRLKSRLPCHRAFDLDFHRRNRTRIACRDNDALQIAWKITLYAHAPFQFTIFPLSLSLFLFLLVVLFLCRRTLTGHEDYRLSALFVVRYDSGGGREPPRRTTPSECWFTFIVSARFYTFLSGLVVSSCLAASCFTACWRTRAPRERV